MDPLLENENVGADSAPVPVVALGAVGIRLARGLAERLDGLTVLEVANVGGKDAAAGNVPALELPAGAPICYVLYDRAEVGTGFVKAVAAQARAGGKVIALEIAAPGEKTHASWRLGVDVLVRAKDEAACRAAGEVLLRMAVPQGLISVDADDVLALFGGADVVQIGVGTATGAQASSGAATSAQAVDAAVGAVTGASAVDAAVSAALGAIPWKPEFLRGILLSLAGGESLGMKEVNAAMDAIMARAAEDCNMVFGADIQPALGDEVRVTLLATCGKRKGSHDASDWMMGMLEERFEDGAD